MKTLKAPISAQKLQLWMRGKSTFLNLITEDGQECAVLLKLPAEKGVDYIYVQYMEGGWPLGYRGLFYNCGIYIRKQDRLYCGNYLSELVKGLPEDSLKSESTLLDEFNQTVNDRVAAVVMADSEKYAAGRIKSLNILKALTRYGDKAAKEEAAALLFTDKKPEDIRYVGVFNRFTWDDGLIDYLLDREGVTNAAVEDFLSNTDLILFGFCKANILRELYAKLLKDPSDPAHTVKAVSDAVESSHAKYVKVTLSNGGQEITVVTSAEDFIGYHSSYETRFFQSVDKREFRRAFGKKSVYTAQDIVRITRGSRTIYEASQRKVESSAAKGGE